jgi:hypothetical protein
MSTKFLSIGRLERRLATGLVESLDFKPGVNLLVGAPNTGKTKWLRTLDYLLGDTGENPFQGAPEEGLAEKYVAAAVELVIGTERLWVERRWGEPRAKTKVFVDDATMSSSEFQQLLLEKLSIPSLNFPKGNPMSGQTWPTLSFRMLFRHIYRQQRFWSGVADLQPEGEQFACLLQFLGLAERMFSEEYGQLVRLKMEIDRLRARRDQHSQTLDELARDIVSEPDLNEGTNAESLSEAQTRLDAEVRAIRSRREALIVGATQELVAPADRSRIEQLSDERAALIVGLEGLKHKATATNERLSEINVYRAELSDELDRMARAEDAGAVLADLRITHCPACDQTVSDVPTEEGNCFLCHQPLPDDPLVEELGSVRLRFEQDRLTSEYNEANELLSVLAQESSRVAREIRETEERLQTLESELMPTRQAVSALVQDSISALDMNLGQLSERQRQLGRIGLALKSGEALTEKLRLWSAKLNPFKLALTSYFRQPISTRCRGCWRMA